MQESLYREVHKGIRSMLFDLLGTAGRVDFSSTVEVERMVRKTSDIFALLSAHAEHENEFLAPLYRALDPEVAVLFSHAHEEQEKVMGELLRSIAAIEPSSASAFENGHRFVIALSSYVAEQLMHMSDEETIGEPLLFEKLDAGKVHDVHQRLVGSIPPAQLALFLQWMIPAASHPERLDLLRGVQAGAPPEVFALVRSIASATLPSEDDARLTRELIVAA